MLGKQLQTAAAGSGAAEGLGIEDVFSTWLYTGTGSSQTITNGIDLAGEGGMVWTKCRDVARHHALYDTERGATKFLRSSLTNAEVTDANSLTSFNSDGFTLGSDISYELSNSNGNYASWTFRKAPGFFDVVTWTGDGTGSRVINHGLNSEIGALIAKRYDGGSNAWVIQHRGLANAWTSARLFFDTQSVNAYSNFTSPTNSTFTVDSIFNTSGQSYVAYLFAHDEQIFGESGSESVIKCGSYTGNGSSTGPVINLGWEPQFVLIKRTNDTGPWLMFDSMRGISDSSSPFLYPNDSSLEISASPGWLALDPTGFTIKYGGSTFINGSGSNYIYIAIRRGPMKTPTDATEVFNSVLTTSQPFSVGFPTDLHIDCQTGSTGSKFWVPRLTNGYMSSTGTSGESAGSLYFKFDLQNNFSTDTFWGSAQTINWQFRRAPGFFDVVAYTANLSTGDAVNHNLGVTPELVICKSRGSSPIDGGWLVWSAYTSNSGSYLNTASAFSNGFWASGISPTATAVYADYQLTGGNNNVSMIAYLFATLPGISKVGSYTGTGTTLSIDCGFTAGARLVIIKRTDSTGDWYVWDTARGIVSGNDPYLLLNSTAAENTSTDYIDPYASGFTVTSTAPAALNASGGNYIFLAIA